MPSDAGVFSIPLLISLSTRFVFPLITALAFMELSIIIPKYCYQAVTTLFLHVKLGVFVTIHSVLYLCAWNYQTLYYQSHCFIRFSCNVSCSALSSHFQLTTPSQNLVPSLLFSSYKYKNLPVQSSEELRWPLSAERTGYFSLHFVSYLFSIYPSIHGPSFLHRGFTVFLKSLIKGSV